MIKRSKNASVPYTIHRDMHTFMCVTINYNEIKISCSHAWSNIRNIHNKMKMETGREVCNVVILKYKVESWVPAVGQKAG